MSMPNSASPTWQIKLGAQIKSARLDRKYRQKRLAEVLGVKRETIRLYEAGKTAPPLPALRQIIQELGATFSMDGIVISPSSFPTPAPRVVDQQTAFDFRGDYTYIGVTVRMAVSKEGFELRGYAPTKVVNT